MIVGNRHLSHPALEEYLATRSPATIVVPGDPVCRIVIDPYGPMTLTTPRHGPFPVLDEFEHIHARTVALDGTAWFELVADHGDRPHEAYLLLCDVADLIQQSGQSFGAAVRDAVATFENLLARSGVLGAEQQTGLYGELLFLEACLTQMPADKAVGAWRGPEAHEHDFVLPGVSFEIKTTRAARRRHRIGGLDQLDTPIDAPLWLVSIQLTDGSSQSRTLPELIDGVRTAAGAARPELDAMLARAGWRERDRARYPRRSSLRSVPTAYPVDKTFPTITRTTVDRMCARPELIVDVEYTLDLTSLHPGSPPVPAVRFVEGDT